jgi:hypothetical protein
MKTIINPDPHAEGFTPQPIYNVTAVLDHISDVFSIVESLEKSGFTEDKIFVFVGQDGLDKLDLHGQEHGVLARVVRTLEGFTAEAEANHVAEEALKEGRMFIAVSTDGSDQQKVNVEQILKLHNAQQLHYFGRWTVERL